MYKSEHIITSKHYLVLWVTAFASGIFISLSLGIRSALFIATVLFVVFLLTILFSILFKKVFSKTKHYILPMVLLLSFLAGILRVDFRQTSRETSIKTFADSESWVFGTLSSEPHLTSSKFYYTFELDTFRIGENAAHETIIVYIPKDRECNFSVGDAVFFWAELRGVSHPESSSEYDYFINLSRRNIFLIANTKNINLYEENKPFSVIGSLKHLGNIIRNKISAAVDSLFPEGQNSTILKGLLIGDKSDFDDEMYNKLSNAGISHIVAVSGLHLSILLSFFMILFGFLRIKRKIILFVALPFVLLFASASGFTPSVLRASIMIFIMMLSTVLSEDYNPVTSLFAAFGILLAFSPYSILSKSLVLSFSATLGILVYFRYIHYFLLLPFESGIWDSNKTCRLFKKIMNYLSSSISLSISSFLGTAYFILLFFSKISKVQFLTNLWIIPTVWLIFCLGYISCIIFYIFPWVSLNILKYPLGWILNIVTTTINFFGNNRFSYEYPLELSSFAHAAVYFGSALIVYMTLKAFFDIREQKKKAAEKNGC